MLSRHIVPWALSVSKALPLPANGFSQGWRSFDYYSIRFLYKSLIKGKPKFGRLLASRGEGREAMKKRSCVLGFTHQKHTIYLFLPIWDSNKERLTGLILYFVSR